MAARRAGGIAGAPRIPSLRAVGRSCNQTVGPSANLMQRIGLIVHPWRQLDRPLDALAQWAVDNNAEVTQLSVAGQTREVAPAGEAASCDFVVALGGDGTALAALHAGARAGKPVLGVACGSLGALTAVHANSLREALDRMTTGDWTARTLSALKISGETVPRVMALNDFVFIRGGAGQLTMSIEVDRQPFIRYSGDGVIVSTQLGSSAYTLGAGGPLLHSRENDYVVTPLAAHGGFCPPIVLGPDATISLLVEPGHGGARMEADGRIASELTRFEPYPVTITMVPDHAMLAVLDGHEPVLAGLRRRRVLMDSPRLLARDDRLRAASERNPPIT